ncbi:unnamed protein product [Dovyalis caffra]|uniref:Uncharacterized protein n=1 Tax=Dovyalis caffra TaxID=77055 RepID=A0AAV1RNB3_9ROSI|nr:unnamed protein product [Dovyalis caffra]
MSALYFDDNAFDLIVDEKGEIDVTKSASKAEANLAKKKKKQQQKLEKQLANDCNKVSGRDLATKKNYIVVYSNEIDEKEEQKTVDYFDGNEEIDWKIVAQERFGLEKEKEKENGKNDDFERDLNEKKVKKQKHKKGISKNKEERNSVEEEEGSPGVVRGLFMVLHKAVTALAFMALRVVMYSTWKKL